MARHTQRLRRLNSRFQGDHEDLERARLERMTDEELEAELVEIAVQSGFDAEAAERDPYSALTWVEEHLNALVDALPEEERAAYVAQHGEPRARPALWPKRRPREAGAEAPL